MARFVVQEHFARSHHFDFRLERDGVSKSWAVPKGVPEQIGISRLAIQVEDQAFEFGGFEGTKAEGQYGAGKIGIWDECDYQVGEWSATLITINLRGSRVNGSFELTRFKNAESHK